MTEHYLGLISGTSADGIDAALVRFDPAPRLVAARMYPYPAALRAQILDVSQQSSTLTLDDYGMLDQRIGCAFADAAAALLAQAAVAADAVAAVGTHGQTLRHRPFGPAPFTLQAGDPSQLAERLGVTVVGDFRRRDVAAGGQGAPLVPAFHAATMHAPDEHRAVLNIGGIANLTLLPSHGDVRGFDTGPGNGLMDAWTLRHRGDGYDRDGAFAASGTVDRALLHRLLDEPYFTQPPPKSTGRDLFHLEWLDARLSGSTLSAADVQATLLELTVASIADALRATQPDTARVLVCGGGVHNGALMRRLAERLAPIAVDSTAGIGIDPDFVEAMTFAWLARETLSGRPGNLSTVTGARGARVLGAIYSA